MSEVSPSPPAGTVAERAHLVDQDLINRYAQVSGDLNPLHTDPEFAKTTFYGRTIAHGMLTLAFVSQAMRDWVGAGWETSGVLRVTFVAPVFAGDEVVVRIEARPSTPLCKVECRVGDRLTLIGEAGVSDG